MKSGFATPGTRAYRYRYAASVMGGIASALFFLLAFGVIRDGFFGLGVACCGLGLFFLASAVSWTFWVRGHGRLGMLGRWQETFSGSHRSGAYTFWGAAIVLFSLGVWIVIPGSGAPADPGHSFAAICFGFGLAFVLLGWMCFRSPTFPVSVKR